MKGGGSVPAENGRWVKACECTKGLKSRLLLCDSFAWRGGAWRSHANIASPRRFSIGMPRISVS
jgi:hypothetical protein